MPEPPDQPRRPRGRPRVAEPLTAISTRLPPRHYDKLIRLANAREVSVADLTRSILLGYTRKIAP